MQQKKHLLFESKKQKKNVDEIDDDDDVFESKELDHPKKGFISIQSIDDNECFKCCLVRYLHPAYHDTRRIRKVGQGNFIKENFILKI